MCLGVVYFLKGKDKCLYSTVFSHQDCFASLADLFNQYHFNFSGNDPATMQLMREGCTYKYPPVHIARYYN